MFPVLTDVLAQDSSTQDKTTIDQNDPDAYTYEEACFENKVCDLILFCFMFCLVKLCLANIEVACETDALNRLLII